MMMLKVCNLDFKSIIELVKHGWKKHNMFLFHVDFPCSPCNDCVEVKPDAAQSSTDFPGFSVFSDCVKVNLDEIQSVVCNNSLNFCFQALKVCSNLTFLIFDALFV